MDNYIGLDVHYQSTTAVVLNSKGEEVLRQVLPTREFHLRKFLSSINGSKALTFEEGCMAKWLVGVMHGCVDKLLVCNPIYVTKKSKAKTDYIDALHLAKELRAGNLVQVFHDHENPLLDMRLLVSAYRSLVRQNVQSKNRYKAMFRAEGIDLPSGESCYTDYELNFKLYSPVRREITMRLQVQISEQQNAKNIYLEKFKKVSKYLPEIEKVRQLPGIEYVRAITIASIVGDANRFPNKYHFWSYCGLVNHKQISGGTTYSYKKSRGRRELKEVFMGAALSCIQGKDNAFRALYERLRSKGIDDRSARKAVARKLASVSLTIMRTGNNYDESLI